MPRARKGSAPRRGGQRRGGGARSSTQADSGSSEDEAASEAHSTTSECASQLSAAAEEGLVPRPGRVLSRACAWPSQPVCSPTSCWSAASPWPTPWKSASRKARARSRPWPRPCWACCACRWAPAPRVRSSSTACSRCSSLCSATARPALLPGCTAHLLSAWAATWLPRTSRILVSCLTCLEGVFSRSCSGRGSSPVVPTSLQGLLCAALQAWALLLTICPSTHIGPILDRQLPRLPQLLSSESVNLRMAAGETIALLFELARDLEEDFVYEDTEALCSELRTLATDSNKYRAKADRRRQRSTFRAVLHFVEGGECEEETIRFGLEVLYVDSWARRRVYAAFKDALGSGMHHHLQNNELLRDIFGLGPVLVLDAAALKACKISRFEKHLYNAAAFRARTKARSRVRDKRADVL
ncbi:interferon-related developmental regulator 2 isoform X2 [Bos indicus x Bos taurus]|uniref:interferon-related developmental regulator 2 isoform X2 n=1 Tax=Bos indicus x Bos taurus TaxID=30522 RepID=UPI000F7D3612|nr:interferon-related developmental regulator 2 isoform X2 [Bos indicus x Bos taurus]